MHRLVAAGLLLMWCQGPACSGARAARPSQTSSSALQPDPQATGPQASGHFVATDIYDPDLKEWVPVEDALQLLQLQLTDDAEEEQLQHGASELETVHTGRRLLHRCHRLKCLANTKCPRCKIPKGVNPKTLRAGHCTNERRLFSCNRKKNWTEEEKLALEEENVTEETAGPGDEVFLDGDYYVFLTDNEVDYDEPLELEEEEQADNVGDTPPAEASPPPPPPPAPPPPPPPPEQAQPAAATPPATGSWGSYEREPRKRDGPRPSTVPEM